MHLSKGVTMKGVTSLVLPLAALLVLAAPHAARSQEAAKPAEAPEVVKTGTVKVTVEAPSAGTVRKATLYAKGKTAPVAAGQEVEVSGVAVGKAAVTVDATVEEGPKKVPKRYLGVAETTVVEGEPQAVKVVLVAVPDIDAYCLTCHPHPRDPNTKVKPGQLVRDIHSSGKEFPEKGRDKYLAMNKAHNEKVAKLEKEGKPHSMPMPLEERVVKVKGKDVKQYLYTCETCHTLHLTTPWVRYARAAYRDKSDLCAGCHF